MKKSLMLLTLLAVCITSTARADDAAVQATLNKLGMNNTELQSSPVPGMKAAITDNGVVYITDDGKHILQGPMYDVSGQELVNVTNTMLLKKLDTLKSEMIVYKADKEKHVITVFTDITCGYCQKLHKEMKEYNDLGITVRYLAFPRQGLDSKTATDMTSIWCTANRNKTLDAAMRGDKISSATCKTDISGQFKLGVQFGVTGTPAIVLENGMVLPGYQSPKNMLAMLDAQAPSQKSGG